jgi:formiminotetrahydrofolate cyclodeaminase
MIGNMTVARLLACITSEKPAPGAGAAGAIALALGVACARKALRITSQHHLDESLVRTVEARLATLSTHVLELGDQDAERFGALIAAMQLAHDDAWETEARDQAKDNARRALRSNTAKLVATCGEAEAQLNSIADHVSEIMIGDIAAARALIGAARTIHAANLAESDSDEK